MISTNMPSRRRFLAGSLAALLSLGMLGFGSGPAKAHEAKCPYCKLDVVQDTPTLDNEVALRYGRKRIEYRCVFCALAQAKTKFQGDVTIVAPSEVKGKPVTITRINGQWSVSPSSAVFVGEKANHRYCQTTYRAITNKAGFDAYVQKNPRIKGAQPLTLAQMVELSK